MSSSDRVAAGGRVSAWTLHLSALAALLAMLVILYWKSVAAAVTVWWVSPTFSHCFLIIPVSAYLIWGKRRALAAQTPAVYPRALWLAVPVVMASLAGALASVNEIEQLALIGFVQVLTLVLLGPRVYRIVLFPALFLFFLVPMGEYLIAPLQRFTTFFIDTWLNLLGILHYTEGNLIQLANGTYQVAEACAGLRFLIATIAVGTLFAHFTYSSWKKIALFMAACVVVPIIGNGFRALGIVLLAHFSNNTIAVGADHLVYGWGFSVVILAALMWVGSKFADAEPAQPAKASPQSATPPPSSNVFPLTVLAALIAMSAVPAFAAWRANTSEAIDTLAFAKPPAIAGWSVQPVSSDWAPLYGEPDAKMAFAVRDSASFAPQVDVFVDYYAGGGRNLISSQNKMWDEDVWHPVLQGNAKARMGARAVVFRELQLSSGGVSRLVWWTYASGGRFTNSGMDVKLDNVRTALMGGRGAAVVAISTLVDSDLDAARARLRSAAAVLGPVKQRIDGP